MSAVKKILVVGLKGSGKLSLLKKLTGSLPIDIPPDGHGGVTHEHAIKNQYYEALVDIWVEEFDEGGVDDLCTSYCSQEAAEVRASLGVLVLTFRKNQPEELITRLLEAIKAVGDLCPSDTRLLAVGSVGTIGGNSVDAQRESSRADTAWDDLCIDEGFEYIDLDASGKNSFGEKVGIDRLKETVETCDWSDTTIDPGEEELLADLMAEDASLNKHLLDQDLEPQDGNSQEASVDKLEKMIQRVLMAREHIQDLTAEEKQRAASKLLADVMRMP